MRNSAKQSRRENPLLSPILDHLYSIVPYSSASIFQLQDNDLSLVIYRGPIPQANSLSLSFSLDATGGDNNLVDPRKLMLFTDLQDDTPLARSFRQVAGQPVETTLGNIRSRISTPLTIDGRVIGVLMVSHYRPFFYSPQQAQLVQEYGNQVAVNIENAILYAETRQRADEIKMLFDVQQAVTSHLKSEAVMQFVVEKARHLTSAQQAFIFLLADTDLQVAAVASDPSPHLPVGTRVPLDSTLIGRAIHKGAPLRQVELEPGQHANHEIMNRTGAHSLLCVPLIAGAKPMGAITVINKQFSIFGPTDERVLAVLASCAVVGLENARNYEQERIRRRVAEGLRNVVTTLNSKRPLGEMLDTILEQASQLLSMDAAAVYRLESPDGPLLIEAVRGLPASFRPGEKVQDGLSCVREAVAARRPIVRLFPPVTGVDGRDCFTALASPLLIKDQPFGGIEIYTFGRRQFTQDEIDLLVMLADQAALAIETAQLNNKVEDLARLEERKRIAQALHDTVAQLLFSLGLEASQCAKHPAVDQVLGQGLRKIRRLAARGSDEIRGAIFALNSGDPAGAYSLKHLLEDQVDEFQSASGIRATLIAPASLGVMPSCVVEAVYRIVREALANIHKHTTATAVVVHLANQERTLTVTITDNGAGMDPGRAPEDNLLHFGVKTMRQVTEQAKGTFKMANSATGGVRVQACFPLAEEYCNESH